MRSAASAHECRAPAGRPEGRHPRNCHFFWTLVCQKHRQSQGCDPLRPSSWLSSLLGVNRCEARMKGFHRRLSWEARVAWETVVGGSHGTRSWEALMGGPRTRGSESDDCPWKVLLVIVVPRNCRRFCTLVSLSLPSELPMSTSYESLSCQHPLPCEPPMRASHDSLPWRPPVRPMGASRQM